MMKKRYVWLIVLATVSIASAALAVSRGIELQGATIGPGPVAVGGGENAKDLLCTDGLDCYCDCVEDTTGGPPSGAYSSARCEELGIPIDLNLLWCDDFEWSRYEEPGSDPSGTGSGWVEVYETGTVACNVAPHEGFGSECINILHDETSTDFDAGDNDFNCGAPHLPTWDDCVFQGNQSFGEPLNDTGNTKSGGQQGHFYFAPQCETCGIETLSLTFAWKVSPNYECNTDSGGTCKGDRLVNGDDLRNSANPPIAEPLQPLTGGSERARGGGANTCNPGWGTPPASGRTFPVSAAIFMRDNCGDPPGSGNGINFDCECGTQDDTCFSTAATRQGQECHVWDTGGQGGRWMSLSPFDEDYDWGVFLPNPQYGGSSVDGRNQWLCVQWTMKGLQTTDGEFRSYINGVKVMDFDGLEWANSVKPVEYKWESLFTVGIDSLGGTNQIRARDNFHLTASATPIPCSQIGFENIND